MNEESVVSEVKDLKEESVIQDEMIKRLKELEKEDKIEL